MLLCASVQVCISASVCKCVQSKRVCAVRTNLAAAVHLSQSRPLPPPHGKGNPNYFTNIKLIGKTRTDMLLVMAHVRLVYFGFTGVKVEQRQNTSLQNMRTQVKVLL